jgi:branched-chain amino acid transport system substrate-binding protein
MKGRKCRWGISLFAGAAAFVAMSMASAFAAPAPYQIDVIDSLTGIAAFLGNEAKQALLVEEKATNAAGGIDGRPIQFVFYDDQSTPSLAVSTMAQLLATHPPVILGSALTSTCNAMAAMVQGNGPVMYCFSPAIHPKPGSYVFSAGSSTRDTQAALIRYFRLRGWTRIALLTSTDASGQDGEDGLMAAIKSPENAGIHVVADLHFATTDISVAAQIERIKALNPQALIFWTTGSPAGTVFKGIVQGGLDIPVGTTDSNMSYAQMKAYASFLPKDSYFVTALWPPHPSGLALPAGVEQAQKLFYSAFQQDTGGLPDHGATTSWDAGAIVLSGLRQFGLGMTAPQLRSYIANLTNYDGVDGIYNFVQVPQRGLTPQDTLVTLWSAKNHAWEVVSKPGGAPASGVD